MTKSLLFVCLVLFGVAAVTCQGQIRFGNAFLQTTSSWGLGNEVGVLGNITLTVIPSGVLPATDIFPKGYLPLPHPDYPFGVEQSFFGYQFEDTPTPSTNLVNITLEELQSYSFVVVGSTESDLFFDPNSGDPEPITTIEPPVLFVVEERPNPSPLGKALLKVVNAIAPSFNAGPISVDFGGQAPVSIDFASDSGFIEFDSVAEPVTLEVTSAFANYTVTGPITLTTNATTLVFLRGDLAPSAGYMSYRSVVGFAFPAAQTPGAEAPVAEPVATPTAAPGTNQPVSTPTSTAPRPRTPTSRVSSAGKSVAQVGAVFGILALLM